jgi:hypothetical protein
MLKPNRPLPSSGQSVNGMALTGRSKLLVFLLVHLKSTRAIIEIPNKIFIHMGAGPTNIAGVLGIPALLAFSSTNETDAIAGFWRVRVTRLFGCPAEGNRAAQIKF